jgi:hypothetical protein
MSIVVTTLPATGISQGYLHGYEGGVFHIQSGRTYGNFGAWGQGVAVQRSSPGAITRSNNPAAWQAIINEIGTYDPAAGGSYYDVVGRGGYTYRLYPDNSVRIVKSGAGSGAVAVTSTGTVAPTAAVISGVSQGGSFSNILNNIFAAAGGGDAAAGKQALLTQGLAYAPQAAEGLSDLLNRRKRDQVAIQNELVKLAGKLAKARAKGQASKAAKYEAKIAEFKARLSALQSASLAELPMVLDDAPVTTSNTMLYAGLGISALVVIGFLVAASRGGQ